jgi:hypothetical protein
MNGNGPQAINILELHIRTDPPHLYNTDELINTLVAVGIAKAVKHDDQRLEAYGMLLEAELRTRLAPTQELQDKLLASREQLRRLG